MSLQLITAPAVEPISLEEAALHLKSSSSEDALVRAIIQAVREQAEHKTGRALIDQRWERSLSSFPGAGCAILSPRAAASSSGFANPIPLAAPPLIGVESVSYVDANGTTQTVSSSAYLVDEAAEPARVFPAYGTSWPSARAQPNAMRVRFFAGYACGVTVNAATNVFTHSGLRTIANDAVLRLTNSGGALPAGLSAGVDYYVVNASGKTFQLAATLGGAPIDVTDTGTGLHYIGEVPRAIRNWMLIAAGTLYEHRESVVTGTIATELKFLDRLLDRYTVPRV
jgi:hypothetical protein